MGLLGKHLEYSHRNNGQKGLKEQGSKSLIVLGQAGIQIISATLMDEWREVAN